MWKIAYLLILISVIACAKKPTIIEIEGYLTESHSSDPVKNGTVKIFSKILNNTTLSDKFSFVDETTTDSAGFYKITIPYGKIIELKINITHDDFYEKDILKSLNDLKSSGVNIFENKVDAKAWLKIHLLNDFISPGETLNLFRKNLRENCETCCSNGSTSFFEYGDTSFICPVVGGSSIQLNYGEATIGSSFVRTIVCPSFKITDHIIKY